MNQDKRIAFLVAVVVVVIIVVVVVVVVVAPQPPSEKCPPLLSNECVVSISTIPSRIKFTEPIIASFFQDPRVTKVYVHVAKTYTRFPEQSIVIPTFMQEDSRIVVNWVPEDFGPATKVFGALLCQDISPETIVLVTDDDTEKRPQWAQALLRSVTDHPDGVSTLHPDLVYGGRGFAFIKDIFDVEDVLTAFHRKPECHRVDDHFFTYYCRYRGIPLHPIKKSRSYIVPETDVFVDKLRDESRALHVKRCTDAFSGGTHVQ